MEWNFIRRRTSNGHNMNQLTNYNYCQETIKMKEQIEIAFIAMGERLMKIRDQHLYGGSWETFSDYLKELKIKDSVASRMITVYKKFILEYKMDPQEVALAGGWSNAYEIVGKSSSKEEAEIWLEKFKYASNDGDVTAIKKELRSGISRYECPHEETYTIKICRRCGEKVATLEE